MVKSVSHKTNYKKRGEDKMSKKFSLTKTEANYIQEVAAPEKTKDNMMFLGETTNEVYLLLHGGYDKTNGYVIFNQQKLTLRQVFQNLKKEPIFVVLKALQIKHINVLCCHSFYQDSYQEDGIIIETVFNNKGNLIGKRLSPNEYQFITEEEIQNVA